MEVGDFVVYNCFEKVYPDGTVQRRFYSKFIVTDGLVPLPPVSIYERIVAQGPDLVSYFRKEYPGFLERFEYDDVVVHDGSSVERGERQNMSRARQIIYDLARSNEWNWFVTLTFDDSNVFRDDYDSVAKVLRSWTDLIGHSGCKWLLVPEFHKDGRSFHFHGLVQGPLSVVPGIYHNVDGRPDLEGKEVWYKDKQSGQLHQVFNVSNWFYGWSTATEVLDQKRVSSYLTKQCIGYMLKGTQAVVPKGRKRYWASRSLLRPIENRLVVSAKDFKAAAEGKRYVKTYKDIYNNEIILTET